MAARITPEKRRQIVELLVEGNSCRSTSRICDVHLETVLHTLNVVGEGCFNLLNHRMRGLTLRHLQIDEIHTFCGKRQPRLKGEEKNDLHRGEQYMFFAIDEDTKLVPCHRIGKRNAETTQLFMTDLSRRIVTPNIGEDGFRPQISTDGMNAYPAAIDMNFANTVKYGQLIKIFSNPDVGRYSPPDLARAERKAITGISDIYSICTSHIERANLSVRTFMKRFTRLALGFSRKWENLRDAARIHFAYHNFCWIHGTLKTTPAVAAGLCEGPWTLDGLLQTIELF